MATRQLGAHKTAGTVAEPSRKERAISKCEEWGSVWSDDGKRWMSEGSKRGWGRTLAEGIKGRWQEQDVNNGASEWERGGGRSDPCRRGDGGCDWPELREWVQGFRPIEGRGWLHLDSGGRFLDHTSSEEGTTCPAAAQPNASRIVPLTRGYPFFSGLSGKERWR